MTKQQRAIVLAVAAFVAGFALCGAVFAAAGVAATFLVGPAIAVGAGAVAVYRSALSR